MYKSIHNSDAVIYLPTNTFIPNEPTIAAWQEYQAWIAAGNTPKPADPEPSQPRQVDMRRARLALLQQGLLDDVEAAVAAAGQAVQIEWEYATTISETSTLFQSIVSGLDWSQQTVDDLFALALSLE